MNYPPLLLEKAKNIKLLILDVDGVLTSGQIHLLPDGKEIKVFNSQDGYGIKCIQRQGIFVAIISGRQSSACTKRMNELNVTHVFQGIHEKLPIFEQLIQQLQLTKTQCAYVGDDVPDVPIMEQVGLKVAVQNATDSVKKIADWQTTRAGGLGAVREVCDLLIHAQQMIIDYGT